MSITSIASKNPGMLKALNAVTKDPGRMSGHYCHDEEGAFPGLPEKDLTQH